VIGMAVLHMLQQHYCYNLHSFGVQAGVLVRASQQHQSGTENGVSSHEAAREPASCG
jgi:hypothetical protein